MNLNNSEQVLRLVDEIMLHKEKYYKGEPIISDLEFDRLEDSLRLLDSSHPVLNMVGYENKKSVKNNKIAHSKPMLSLQKTYELDELEKWRAENELIGMLKIDGNSLSLIYENGKLVKAKTRGDGKVGEDVLSKVLWVSEIPKVINCKNNNFEVRGELHCLQSSFTKLQVKMQDLGLDTPTNPRNVVAGILGRKIHEDLARFFSFFAFDLIYKDEVQITYEQDLIKALRSMNFITPFSRLLESKTELEEYISFTKSTVAEGEIGIDGAVLVINAKAEQSKLGYTAHHPKYKLAFKWAGETKNATIMEISWSTSRLGIVTPVAIIDPVYLSGASIKNVTLHNAANVKAFNLKKGDVIEIIRSGEVIPKLLRVISSSTEQSSYEWPKKCNSCLGELVFDDVRLLCMNQNCKAQVMGKILNYISSVGIEDLSEKRLEIMMQSGLINNIVDLYKVSVDDFLSLPQTKEKLALKLYSSIQNNKKLELEDFLVALSIGGIGKVSWEKISEYYPNLNLIQSLGVEEIVAIAGFAQKTAVAVVKGLESNKKLISELLNIGIVINSKHKSTDVIDFISGKTFVITGKLSRPRKEIVEFIKKNKGKVVSSVSSKTDIIICNDVNSTSSKAKSAKELKINFLSEDELFAL